jgi:hypothetical protein
MFGCLRRAGCLVLLLIIACGLYLTRSRWMPYVSRVRHPNAVATESWQPLSRLAARSARTAIAGLDRREGPVFANLQPEEFASFILDSAGLGVTNGQRIGEARADGDRLVLRSTIRVSDLGAGDVPLLKSMLDRNATVVMSGPLSVVSPRLGAWAVRSITVGGIDMPGPVVTRIVRSLSERISRPGTPEGALGFRLPSHIADLRVSRGKVTLYKVAQ